MLLPYSTDAPIYHFPYATLGLIGANVLVFIAEFMLPAQAVNSLVLTYGTLNPLQWITSNFIHAGIFHILGNMICLWVFGLIVEGKLGWLPFLAVYFGIGVGECAVEQVLMWNAAGISCGASAIIFGLMMIALVWAPLNNVSCLLLLGWVPRTLELSITWFCGVYLVNEAVVMWLHHFRISSAFLHLLGGVAGAVLGVALLRMKLVDCENWDAFSVFAGRHTRSRDELASEKAASKESQQKAENRRAQLYSEVEHTIAQGNVLLAWRAHQTMTAKIPGWKLPSRSYNEIIVGAQKQKLWSESVPMMVEYVKAYPAETSLVRLKLAEVLVKHESRPAQALKVLEKIPQEALDAQQTARCEAIRR